MKDSILKKLQQLTAIEQKQLSTNTFFEDLPVQALDEDYTLNNYFFNNKDVFISKHNRFADYPIHAHTFLELNYVLQGSATEIVNGETLTLETGDLILLDIGTKHTIKALGKEDLLINILFRDVNINLNLLKELKSNNNILFDFLLKKSLTQDAEQPFLLFKTQKATQIQQILDEIIAEYYLQAEFADSIIKSYLDILIIQLIRHYHIEVKKETSSTQKLAINMLADIKNEFATISLSTIAKRYNYNRNYLSNIFKKEVGQTFSESLTHQRILQAHNLITTTQLPIAKIMELVGINNKSFFYAKYKKQYNQLPLESRKN